MESIISQKIQRINGKDAWRENLRLSIFAADKVRSSLGPKGAYKLVSYQRGPEQVVKVTKDSIAILEELAIQNPPAVIVSEAAKLQREEAGDGVATFVIFLSALLKKADELLTQGIHSNTIIHGYHLATDRALEIIERRAFTHNGTSDILDSVDCKRNLLTPQIRSMIRQAYPSTYVGGRFEKESVRFLKKQGGCLGDLKLFKGIVIIKQKAHPNMPDNIKDARIAITSERLGINRLEVKMPGQGPYHINLNIKTPGQMKQYSETIYKIMAEPIKKLAELNVNVLLCEQPIEENLKEELKSKGIFALESVDKKDTQSVSEATGANIIGNLNELSQGDIGIADTLSTDRIDLEKTVIIEGCKGATFLLRGTTTQIMDELEAAIKNSFVILKLSRDDCRVLPGSGAIEVDVAQELKNYAREFATREQLVIDAFARALLDVPTCLAENYGLNPIDTLIELKKRHTAGFCNFGIDEINCSDMVCEELIKVKRSVFRRAYEVSMFMLRIDELLISKEIPKFHKK